MKKILILFISIIVLASCTEETSADGFTAIAVDFPSYDALRAVIGDTGSPSMLLPPGIESHSYDPTPKDMTRIAEADLVVFTGGESDAWVYSILSSIDPPPVFTLISQVDLLEEIHDDENHHHHGFTADEHVWTSVANFIRIVDNLASVLSSINPEHEAEYRANADSYISELIMIDSEIREIVSQSRLDTLIFASRFPLQYFVAEYGLSYYAAFPGCSEETEPSAKTVAMLIDEAKRIGTGYILNIEFSSQSIARTIAEEAGCSVAVFYSMHNISAADFGRGETYLSLMRRNAETLREVLS